MILTKDHVAAIRAATSASFRFTLDGQFALHLTRKVRTTGVFATEAEGHVTIEDAQATSLPYDSYFWCSYTNHGAWQLLAKSVRVGDELTFICRDNNSQNMIEAGWTTDECLVTVRREGKYVVDELLLDYSTCPVGSLARSIRGRKVKEAA